MILNPTKQLRALVDQLADLHSPCGWVHCPNCQAIAEGRAAIRALPWPAPEVHAVRGFAISSRDLVGQPWTVEHHARRLGMLPSFQCPVCDAVLTEKDWKARHCENCEPITTPAPAQG